MLEERAAQWKDEYIALGRKEGEAIGEARGEAIGEARGEARGEIKGLRRAVLFTLTTRFGSLLAPVSAYVNGISDCEKLDRMILYAVQAESPQSFLEMAEKD